MIMAKRGCCTFFRGVVSVATVSISLLLASQSMADPIHTNSEYAAKIQGIVFRRDVETFPSCLLSMIGDSRNLSNPSVGLLVSVLTTCRSQSAVFEEGRRVTRAFFNQFCGKEPSQWPLVLRHDDVLFACNMRQSGTGLQERLKAIDAREASHFGEIRWLEKCLKRRKVQKSC